MASQLTGFPGSYQSSEGKGTVQVCMLCTFTQRFEATINFITWLFSLPVLTYFPTCLHVLWPQKRQLAACEQIKRPQLRPQSVYTHCEVQSQAQLLDFIQWDSIHKNSYPCMYISLPTSFPAIEAISRILP